MGEITVDIDDERSIAEVSRRFLILPDGLAKAIKEAIDPEVKRVSAKMLSNVSGGVLHQVSGKLASTVNGYTRMLDKGSVVFGRAGSKYYIGRFWEGGFNLKMRNKESKWMAPRQWAHPPMQGEAARIGAKAESAIIQHIKAQGL